MEYIHCDFRDISDDPRAATKHLLDKLLTEIHPTINDLCTKIQAYTGNEEEVSKINEAYKLCLSQITKCFLNLFEIFRLEYSHCTVLQESRQCNLERLSWCLDRLRTLKQYLDHRPENDESANEYFGMTTMHFVNWIDHAFANLKRLSEVVYKKDTDDVWKTEMVECISGVHVSIDELILCAMTLYRYCLPGDQIIIRARCQVVLRDTKALLTGLVEGDVSSTIKATTDALKRPILPSNVNITIEVLKDVLYALETNTNTALLSLVIHCFSSDVSPIDVIKEHFVNGCVCGSEECEYVNEFDLYNERLLQIGSFAVSCSSDQNIILCLRSGLASLEALDPHIVPALMTSPASHHSTLLIKSWKQEVKDIRNNVVLIVDPAPFTEKSKQQMHDMLVDVLKCDAYNNSKVRGIISVGCLVLDFFNTYVELELEALTQQEKLLPLLADLEKVQLECKIVSNLLASTNDFTYKIKMPTNKTTSLEKLNKRIKLLYTLVIRISNLLTSQDDQSLEDEDSKNVTHTIAKGVTYVNSPRKDFIEASRSMFARSNIRSSTRNFPLSNLTKHLRVKSELNFSVKLDDIDLTNEKINKRFEKLKELSAFNFSPVKNRSSLRKVVLNRHLQCAKSEDVVNDVLEKESLFNEDESLQLTEVLNELNNMTNILTTPKSRKALDVQNKSNVLTINVNNQTTIFKRVWNIPVKTGMVKMPQDESSQSLERSESLIQESSQSLERSESLIQEFSQSLEQSESMEQSESLIQESSQSLEQSESMIQDETFPNTSNLSQPSNVTTLERIVDLDFVDDKLNSLKSLRETSL